MRTHRVPVIRRTEVRFTDVCLIRDGAACIGCSQLHTGVTLPGFEQGATSMALLVAFHRPYGSLFGSEMSGSSSQQRH